MALFSPIVRLIALTAALLVTAGCGTSKPTAQTPSADPSQAEVTSSREAAPTGVNATASQQENRTCRDENAIRESERSRAQCFHLQPASTTTKTVTQKPSKSTAKKGKQPATVTKVVHTTGLCQPQSLIYARCRTGIMTCRLGNTSPVQWFACAKGSGNTTASPVAGSVMVLDVNSRRGMPTGHPAYVEEVRKNGDGSWTLRISHTNYDRKCHLDLDAKVLFDPKRMTASFENGPWGPWAKDLKVLGFILR